MLFDRNAARHARPRPVRFMRKPISGIELTVGTTRLRVGPSVLTALATLIGSMIGS